ncbi:hypothetical protein [Streptomyces xantholiticus]
MFGRVGRQQSTCGARLGVVRTALDTGLARWAEQDSTASVQHMAAARPRAATRTTPHLARSVGTRAPAVADRTYELLRGLVAAVVVAEQRLPDALRHGRGPPVLVHELRRGSVLFSGEPVGLPPAGPRPVSLSGNRAPVGGGAERRRPLHSLPFRA